MEKTCTGSTSSAVTPPAELVRQHSPPPGAFASAQQSAWVRSLRGSKEPVDAERAVGVRVESERIAPGSVAPGVTVFLAGSECPFTCVYCDLWKYTLDGPTPAGALPRQLQTALGEVEDDLRWVKLYNASNFFDSRAVPVEDRDALAELVSGFETTVVESHPRLIGKSCLDFADRVDGRVQVAMGLETVHPEALLRLNKEMSVTDFDRAAEELLDMGIGVRAFVLVGVPFVEPTEDHEWVVRSVEHAVSIGVEHVALIPVRDGNGALEQLRHGGEFHPPSLSRLEDALDDTIGLAAIVTADLWDLGRFAECVHCGDDRCERMERMNLSGENEPRVGCGECGVGSR